MSQIGEIPMSWVSFSSHGRWDAPFWLKVTDVLAARVKGRPFTEAEVKSVVEEIEARKEFPGGSMLRPLPTHVECPACLSWDVDSVEVTTRRTTAGVRTTTTSEQYDCLHCHHQWGLNFRKP